MKDNPDRFDLEEWEILVAESARLGLALARWQNALDNYKVARDRGDNGKK